MAKLPSQRAASRWPRRLPDPRRPGDIEEYGIERVARDTRLGPIGGGTDEIMKEILGKQLGSRAARPARRRLRLVGPAAVLVEEAARLLLAVACLVALDADPVDHVEQQHGGAGADEHRSGGQPDRPEVPAMTMPSDEQHAAGCRSGRSSASSGTATVAPDRHDACLEITAVPKGDDKWEYWTARRRSSLARPGASAGRPPSCSRSTAPGS